MARKKVGGKNKSKDVALKEDNLGKSKRSNTAEDDKEKSNSGGSARVLRSRDATKGEGNADEKAKGKRKLVAEEGRKPMAKKGALIIYDGAEKGENAGKRNAREQEKGDRIIDEKAKGKRKLVAEEENSKKAKIQAKRRNTDKEIAESSMSSADKGSYNLRPRKAVPSFQRVGLSESGFAQVIGKRVKVFRSGSRKWLTGQVKSYNNKKKLHKVLYVDGELEELDLKTQRFEVELMPGEASTLCLKHKPNAGKKEMHSDGVSVDAEASLKIEDVKSTGKKTVSNETSAAKTRTSRKTKKDGGNVETKK